jgi:glutamine cyclotransferase
MTIRLRISLLFLAAVLLLFPSYSCSELWKPLPDTGPEETTKENDVAKYTYRVVKTYPHDRNAFTQGLVFDKGYLYEGTGLHGRSSLRRVELATGDVLQIRELPPQFFGEGITVHEDRVIQLTWQSRTGFVYKKTSFELLNQFNYATQGWGIAHDGNHLIMSDGTSKLYFLDPYDFREIGRMEVFDEEGPVASLNELEYVRGQVFANVWLTDRIAVVSPQTGQVTGWIDMEGILNQDELSEPADVLNGIAYDATNDRLFVTGKLWPALFEIELVSSE